MIPWFKIRSDIMYDAKVVNFASMLKVSVPTAAGHLIAMWLWFGNYLKDKSGDLSSFTNIKKILADAAQYHTSSEKKAEFFFNCLLNCGLNGRPGFIEYGENGHLYLHQWHYHMGNILDVQETMEKKEREKIESGAYAEAEEKKREQNRLRQRKFQEKKKMEKTASASYPNMSILPKSSDKSDLSMLTQEITHPVTHTKIKEQGDNNKEIGSVK